MEVAENSAIKKAKMDPNYTFYNAKNRSHFISNCSTPTQTEEQEVRFFFSLTFISERCFPKVNDDPYLQELRDYSYQQQTDETSEEAEVEAEEGEQVEDKEKEFEVRYKLIFFFIEWRNFQVTDGEQTPQASQRPMREREKLPLLCNRHFYNIPVNTNYSVVHVPSNVYERCTKLLHTYN